VLEVVDVDVGSAVVVSPGLVVVEDAGGVSVDVGVVVSSGVVAVGLDAVVMVVVVSSSPDAEHAVTRAQARRRTGRGEGGTRGE